ncbi:hypothetical protein GY45DRAFT_1439115 [Cubamyces sp. BRFM 1775]|nr:hypothetical protein GY45DRAFT_1439115 [Cubamyces sp. BRFM 1775]
MAVVHGRTSSGDSPETPSRPPADQEIPKTGGTPVASPGPKADPAPTPSPKNVDLAQRLRPCSDALVEQLLAHGKASAEVENIASTVTESELYHPAGVLLTLISRTIFDSFSADDLGRLHLEPDRPIVSLPHHSSPLAHSPNGEPKNSPSLVGVFEPSGELHFPTRDDGTYRDIPYHRVETLVELGSRRREYVVRDRASDDIHQFLQARPDRPACYAMSATPMAFDLLYGSPVGLQVSQALCWSDLKTLCAYVYSLYDPPDDHILAISTGACRSLGLYGVYYLITR